MRARATMKRTLILILAGAALLSLAAPGGVLAQVPPVTLERFPLASDWDLDATSYTYVTTTGRNNLPTGEWRQNTGRIVTSGSTTALTSTTGAFTGMVAGDVIRVTYNGIQYYRSLSAVASAAAATANSAIDLTNGASFYWRRFTTGTAATSGWFNTSGFGTIIIQFEASQAVTTTGIDTLVQCRTFGPSHLGVEVYGPTTFPAGTSCPGTHTSTFACELVIDEPQDECRVGFKMTSTDDGGDATTNAEKISASWVGRR